MALQYSANISVTTCGATVTMAASTGITFGATFLRLINASTSGDAFFNISVAASSGDYALKSTDDPLVITATRGGIESFNLGTASSGVTVRVLGIRA